MLGSRRRLQRAKGAPYGVIGKISSRDALHKRIVICSASSESSSMQSSKDM